MIWIIEIVVFIAFVGIGGFPGFIAWAVLSALVLFVQHSNRQAKLKTAELMMQEEERLRQQREAAAPPQLLVRTSPSLPAPEVEEVAQEEGAPLHLWFASSGAVPLDFRTMMWGTARMVRRVSATGWELKYEPGYRAERIRYLQRLLATPPAKDGSDEVDRLELQDELDGLEPEPTWKAFPEKYIAAIETAYQRYIARG